jgi:hypothetical protein
MYRAFLEERLGEYEETLRRWVDGPREQPGREQAIAAWRSRVGRIEAAIRKPSPRKTSRG